MRWIQPASVSFESDSATVELLQRTLAERGRRPVTFRGNERERVGGHASTGSTAHGLVQSYSFAVQSDADLIVAGQALAQAGVKAWMTIATPQGPQPMELGEYLRQRGLA